MQVVNEKKEIKSNIEGGQEYGVKLTAKTFQVLTDKLYTNKVRAIIRELSCNAYDSHVDAGKSDIPFVIKLPNDLDPSFYIEDFGTGMSEEKIYEVYTQFFESDKTNTNEAVGMLGLGSKTPFSKNDSFTVRSRYNGKEMIFNNYINEQQVPSIVKVHEEETNEENGFKVEFPVDRRDFFNFQHDLEDILRPFPVKPIVKGIDQGAFRIEEYKSILEGKGWLFNSRTRYGSNTLRCVQGNVEYHVNVYGDINIQEITKKYLQDERERGILRNLIMHNDVVLFFDIGKLDVAPSREALSLDPRTVDNIAKRLIQMYKEITQEKFKDMFNDNLTLWEIFKNYRKLYTYMNIDVKVLNRYTYKGKKIQDALHDIPDHIKSEVELYVFEEYGRYNNNVKIKKSIFEGLDSLVYINYSENERPVKIIYHDEQDKKRSGIYRIRQHMRKDMFHVLIIYDIQVLHYLGLDYYSVDKISQYDYIKKPGRKSSSTSNSNTQKLFEVYTYDADKTLHYINSYDYNEFKSSPYFNHEMKLYMWRYYKEYTNGKNKKVSSKYTIDNMFYELYQIGAIDIGSVFIILDKHELQKKRFKENNTWTPFLDYFREKITKNLNRKDVINEYKEAIEIIRSKDSFDAYDKQLIGEILNKCNNEKEYILEYSDILKKIKNIKDEKSDISYNELRGYERKIQQFMEYLTKAGANIKDIDFFEEIENIDINQTIENLKDEFFKRYPLLKNLNSYYYKFDYDPLFEYIYLIENCK